MARMLCGSLDTDALLARALRGELDEAGIRRLYARGPEVVTRIMPAMAQRLAQRQTASPAESSPATRCGMIPVYAKAAACKRRRRPGGRNGHPGARRVRPQRIDQRAEHRLEQCPDCGGALQRSARRRTRIIEDIPQEIQPVVTEHTIHRDSCPHCKKDVEPKVPDALPGAALGHRVLALTRVKEECRMQDAECKMQTTDRITNTERTIGPRPPLLHSAFFILHSPLAGRLDGCLAASVVRAERVVRADRLAGPPVGRAARR